MVDFQNPLGGQLAVAQGAGPRGLAPADNAPSPQWAQANPGMMAQAPSSADLLAGSHELFKDDWKRHKGLLESSKRIDGARKAMDGLVAKGDEVTPDDIVDAASGLVGHGFDPQSLAELLATMPLNGGEALQGWVKQKDAMLQQAEQSMQPALAQSTLHLGGRAMASLHLDHLERTQGFHDPGIEPQAVPGAQSAATPTMQ
jgi:hypothetical protein